MEATQFYIVIKLLEMSNLKLLNTIKYYFLFQRITYEVMNFNI